MKPSKTRGKISEVFASIQGEGLHVGTMQLFVRLAAVTEGQPEEPTFVIKTLPGSRNHFARNPVTPLRFFQLLSETFELDRFFTVSFIGEEPLQQVDFLCELLQILKKNRIETFIQTAGVPLHGFEKLNSLVNRWCIDLKCFQEKTCSRYQKNMEKIISVTSPETTYFRLAIDADDDPTKLIAMLETLQIDDYTLVLQPCAIFPAHISDWDTGNIIDWIQLFRPFFQQVRWIPQVHKLLRIL